ncbi:MAG: hypothetical protein AABP62_05410 [Planctomycetota bacterium]
MSVRRVVLSSFVLLALARATCVVAEDSPDKPVLGPAVPIGELLILKAGFDDEPQPLPPAPIPQLNPNSISLPPNLLLAPVDIAVPEGFGVVRAARITPEEVISFHLTQAFMGLTTAGLNEEAKQVGSLLREFETKHQPRLVLAAKQTQLNELQVEIDRLKLRVEKGITADEVQLSVKIIEADGQVAKELLGDDAAALFGEPANRLKALSRLLDRKEFLQLVESKRKDGSLKVLSEPTMVTQSGRPVRFHSGGSLPTPRIAQIGGPVSLEFGTTVLATATIVDADLVRVALTVDFAELNQVEAANDIPTVNRRRAQSTLNLKDGQTAILGGMVASTEAKTVATFITVTAEIMNEIAIPLTPSVEVPQPTPTPIRPVK